LSFSGAEGKLPNGWRLNPAMKQDGHVSGVAKIENGALSFSSDKQYAALFTSERFPARGGQFFKAAAKVSGKGKFAIGIYPYNEKGINLPVPKNDFVILTDKGKDYAVTIPIIDSDKLKAARLCVVIILQPGSELKTKDIQLRIE
ncbi:MAG: hypothetical protein IKS20_13895, partial [Victivallales bacterium]|nr:hypothetical protein [Victivallales bacterium]